MLQGVYQSHQATASACAANNVNLLRGMIGRPGAGILQMNGQPTAQNTRETGCNGDLPAFRNWQNEEHVAELARLWNVEPDQIPHWGPPTHAMEIFRYAEQGSIEFLWVSGTNPAVSLPDLGRIRSILSQESLFLVVSDAFLTETARLADVVLPAALWGEKTGHVHEHRPHRPPLRAGGRAARARRGRDGEIFARLRPPARTEGQGRAAAREVVDAGGVLRGLEGMHARPPVRLHRPQLRQAPRRHRHPVALQRRGARRDRTALRRPRVPDLPDVCEDYGHDIVTGASFTRSRLQSARSGRPRDPQGGRVDTAARVGGRRLPVHAHDRPHRLPLPHPHENRPHARAAGRRPRRLGRAVRGGRGAARDLARATWFASPRHADRSSSRHASAAPAQGVVFVPFHYGYWDAGDDAGPDGRPRAANELTITLWDPVSKQPRFKTAAVKVERRDEGRPAPRPPRGARGDATPKTLRAAADASRATSTTSSTSASPSQPRPTRRTDARAARQRYDGTSDWQTLARDGKTLLEDLRSLYLIADASR